MEKRSYKEPDSREEYRRWRKEHTGKGKHTKMPDGQEDIERREQKPNV